MTQAPLKVLVVGSGGREHALCWKLRSSPLAKEIYCAPGNPGIARWAKLVPIRSDDVVGLGRFAQESEIDLTVVGPEVSLELGIVDHFKSLGLTIFGPTKAAANLETSKYFAKEIMAEAGVKTAQAELFSSAQAAQTYVEQVGLPIVLKADGLAAGKGVVIAQTLVEAQQGLKFIFEELKSSRVLVEQFLVGQEVSFMAISDGERVCILPTSHDHKRIFDNNKGPNTGGMGTVSPSLRLSTAQGKEVVEQIIMPIINTMKARGTPFVGVLYAGLMVTVDGVFVIEFNTRFGDPECQVLMSRIESDLLPVLLAAAQGSLAEIPSIACSPRAAVCVVLAAAGYPENVRKGDVIEGIEFADQLPDTVVFHAGTALNSEQQLVTSGGRVLGVTSVGDDIEQARRAAYRACDMIQFNGRQLRRDIGL